MIAHEKDNPIEVRLSARNVGNWRKKQNHSSVDHRVAASHSLKLRIIRPSKSTANSLCWKNGTPDLPIRTVKVKLWVSLPINPRPGGSLSLSFFPDVVVWLRKGMVPASGAPIMVPISVPITIEFQSAPMVNDFFPVSENTVASETTQCVPLCTVCGECGVAETVVARLGSMAKRQKPDRADDE